MQVMIGDLPVSLRDLLHLMRDVELLFVDLLLPLSLILATGVQLLVLSSLHLLHPMERDPDFSWLLVLRDPMNPRYIIYPAQE